MMLEKQINSLVIDELCSLVQKENFIGWVYSLDYDNAMIVTNDDWKNNVNGVPHNSFLVATSFSPDQYANSDEIEREVVLLRVVGTCKLPQDDDAIKTKIDNYQNQTAIYREDGMTPDEKKSLFSIPFMPLNSH